MVPTKPTVMNKIMFVMTCVRQYNLTKKQKGKQTAQTAVKPYGSQRVEPHDAYLRRKKS